jgi:hypothetical protein
MAENRLGTPLTKNTFSLSKYCLKLIGEIFAEVKIKGGQGKYIRVFVKCE